MSPPSGVDHTERRRERRLRVAILGGGMGGLATAWELTRHPGWRQRYEITVYQSGWRLGGKGASHRNTDKHGRIEEHGLHVLLGYYNHVFRLMDEVYAELKRPKGHKLRTWDEAVRPQNFTTLMEKHEGTWYPWHLEFPTTPGRPGDRETLPGPWTCLRSLLPWLLDELATDTRFASDGSGPLSFPEEMPRWLRRTLTRHFGGDDDESDDPKPGRDIGTPDGPLARRLLASAAVLASLLPDDPGEHQRSDQLALQWFMKSFFRGAKAILSDGAPADLRSRRLWTLIDISHATIKGMVEDDVARKGFASLDHMELTEWLGRHGASKQSLESVFVRSVYELAFAFEDGMRRKPRLAAGVGLQGALLMFMGYRGAFLWKMQAGMGETVFAPLYLALRERGVKFRFFSRVAKLTLSPDEAMIDRVLLKREAEPTDPDGYDPLIDIEGLPCFPHEPIRGRVSASTRGGAIEPLWRGRHFDVAVLAIPVGAQRRICADLARSQRRWALMHRRVKTVRTQAMQLWLDCPAKESGWPRPRTVMAGYAVPFESPADMSQTLKHEGWSGRNKPRQVVYTVGVRRDDNDTPVEETGWRWLRERGGDLWPELRDPANPEGLDWTALTDPSGSVGAERLKAQYFHVSADPSDRYVLSVPGSTRFRMRAGDSGFANLYLAGDWVENGLNVGCMEGAAMGGIQAARALRRDWVREKRDG